MPTLGWSFHPFVPKSQIFSLHQITLYRLLALSFVQIYDTGPVNHTRICSFFSFSWTFTLLPIGPGRVS